MADAEWICATPHYSPGFLLSHERRSLMAATRTPGITTDADGNFLIDKRHRGIRIIRRLGANTQEQAEQRLQTEIQHADVPCLVNARACFADCATRYLAQCHERRS